MYLLLCLKATTTFLFLLLMIQVADQMAAKFGKPFAEQAKANMSGTVNPKVSVGVLQQTGCSLCVCV